MDKTEIINIARQYASIVKSRFDCIEVILFGSHAKGTSHNESDIDIAIILKDYDNIINIQLELMRLRRKIDSRIEPHPFRLKDFNVNNPLINEIRKNGEKINVS